jgi:ribonuclease P protein subunit RPR2
MVSKKSCYQQATRSSILKNHKYNQKFKSRGRIGRRTKEMVDIAKARIRILMSLAERECIKNKNLNRAQRYVKLARNIGMRYNIRMEKYFSTKFCRSCNSFLGSTITCRRRLQGGKIIILCKKCGRIKRFPLNSEK